MAIVVSGCQDDGDASALSSGLTASEVPLTASLTATADNWLRQASPFANDGTGRRMGVGADASSQQVSVLRFDQAALSAAVGNRSLYSAKLQMTLTPLNFHSGWNGGEI